MVRHLTRLLYCVASTLLCVSVFSLYLSADTLRGDHDEGRPAPPRNSIASKEDVVLAWSERRSLKELEGERYRVTKDSQGYKQRGGGGGRAHIEVQQNALQHHTACIIIAFASTV